MEGYSNKLISRNGLAVYIQNEFNESPVSDEWIHLPLVFAYLGVYEYVGFSPLWIIIPWAWGCLELHIPPVVLDFIFYNWRLVFTREQYHKNLAMYL
jgi:hypothetical protein